MDSAATDWHWFWFGLLVIAIVTEIALRAIAATTRHLLVCLTSLGHHNSIAFPPLLAQCCKAVSSLSLTAFLYLDVYFLFLLPLPSLSLKGAVDAGGAR